MKAIQVKKPGGIDALEVVDLPVPQPKSNDAIVKLAATGVNFIDVYHRRDRERRRDRRQERARRRPGRLHQRDGKLR